MSGARAWIAPVGSSMAVPLGELENGDLVVPEDDGVRIWPSLGNVTGFTHSEEDET